MNRSTPAPLIFRSCWALGALAFVTVAGCAVGPDFHRPAPPPGNTVLREPAAATAAGTGRLGAAQRFEVNATIAHDWWSLFESEPLNRLVRESLTNNPTVDAARAAFRQAVENTAAQRGFYFPTVQAGYSPSRQRNAVGTISPTLSSGQESFSLHSAQLNVGYVFDVFGANRRAVENLAAIEEVQLHQWKATELTVSSGVVAAAISEAALKRQVAQTRRVVEINRRLLEVLRRQAELGAASGLDVAAQESALAQAEQSLPALARQLEQTRDAMAVLAGHPPAEFGPSSLELDDIRIPETVPLSLPAAIVRQRPDVLAAEAQLHAASAAVGVAVAARIPQFSLSANAGGTSTKFADLFATGNVFWAVSGNASQTLFDGGTLRHRQRAAQAALEAAQAQYRAAVLTAFQNVADTFYALKTDADALRAAANAEAAAEKSFNLTKSQIDAGFVAATTLLGAEQAVIQAKLLREQAEAARLTDTAALFQALGGGWWNGPPEGGRGAPQAAQSPPTAPNSAIAATEN